MHKNLFESLFRLSAYLGANSLDCMILVYLFEEPLIYSPGFPWRLSSRENACDAGDTGDGGWSLGREDPLEEGVATQSSILAWRLPWTDEPGGLKSRGHFSVSPSTLAGVRFSVTAALTDVRCYFSETGLHFHDD